MAATTLSAIRDALATAIKAGIPDAQCSGYTLGSRTLPSFDIEPDEVVYDLAMSRGLDEWFLIVRGMVATGTDIGAQKKLDAFLASSGTLSLKAAIETDRTLGGVVQDVRVEGVSGYRRFASGDQTNSELLGAEWRLHVYGTGV